MSARRENATKLGELLAARGKLDRTVLLDALRRQRTTGGRLGTCLLELDAVSEAVLLDVLSGQLKLPFVEADELRTIPAEAIRLIPAKIAVARCAVPVRASGTQLSVAMLDPQDLAALDELAFVSGRRIRPHVALEVRLQEALSRSYGHDIPSRFVKLIDRLNRGRFLWKPEADEPASPGEADNRSATVLPRSGSPYPNAPATSAGTGTPSRFAAPPPSPKPPPPPDFHPPPTPTPPLPRSVATPIPSPIPAPTPESASQPLASGPQAARPDIAEPMVEPKSYEATVDKLQSSTEKDDVAEALIDFLRPRVELGLLLMLRRDQAHGWRAVGIEPSPLASLAISLRAPSVVHALIDGAPLHRGPLSALSGNTPLHERFGPDISDLIALPIRVRRRLVAVLIAASRGAPFAAELADELQHLAIEASTALEKLVLRRKLRGS